MNLSAEWKIVISFLLILTTLVGIARVQSIRAGDLLGKEAKPISRLTSNISVVIDGAVSKSGTYMVKRGTSLRKILKRARPAPNANLRGLDLDACVNEPCVLQVPELTEISLILQMPNGERKALQLPLKSRQSDLKAISEVKEVARPSFFQSRRMLKDGEVLEVLAK